VVFACHREHDRILEGIANLSRQLANRPALVVLHTGSSNGFMERAFGAGADDLITLPQPTQELSFALEKAIARRRGAAAPVSEGAMITILGPKGGTGKTLVATNLAVALAQRDANVILVDLDLQFGDIGLALGLSPERTMYDLMKAGPPFDHDKLDRHLVNHSSGVRVLIAPTRPDQASAASIDYLRDIYAALRTMCDAVIVDTPPGFTPEVIATIDVSSEVCMVGMLDSLSLKNTKLGVETLELMGYDSESITLVLNRSDSRVGIMPDDVSAIVGRTPDVSIPSDREIPRSINEGTPIVAAKQSSGAARAFRALADRYARVPAPTPTPLPSSPSAVRSLIGRRR
jgi:pilus assembly protein CpaE